jgi:hypothetical protein
MPKAKFSPLPYAIWVTKDGSEVLFSRSYHPLYRRQPGQPATVANVYEIMPRVRMQHFYDDGTYLKVAKRLRHIELDFIEGIAINTDSLVEMNHHQRKGEGQ